MLIGFTFGMSAIFARSKTYVKTFSILAALFVVFGIYCLGLVPERATHTSKYPIKSTVKLLPDSIPAIVFDFDSDNNSYRVCYYDDIHQRHLEWVEAFEVTK